MAALQCSHVHLVNTGLTQETLLTTQLYPFIQQLKNLKVSGSISAAQLARAFNISERQCLYQLTVLFELGILADENESCMLVLEDHCYDLKKSPTFCEVQKQKQQESLVQQLFYTQSIRHIKKVILTSVAKII